VHKILLIENDSSILANYARVLTLEGFEVLTAINGLDGLRLARTREPDLILCDLRMPEMDGDAVLAALRADPRTVRMPFIFMTASADHSERAARLAQGANDYLVKPIEFKVLLEAIARQLGTRGAPT
jgi:DNA-binding response OmpR family regulator